MFENRHKLNVKETKIHEMILQMYQHADDAIESAIQSLMSQDAEIAEAIVKDDANLNTLHRQVEKECMMLIATQQPVARDLLEIIASLQISSEFERIGDHAKSIAKIVMGMDASDFSGPIDKLSEMSYICKDMCSQVMEAYSNRDAELARNSASTDDEIDDLNQMASSSLLIRLVSEPDQAMHATHLLWIAYHLERIGDRINNIAERVVFMVTAETPDLN
jgi:phosphate transport system protein